MEPGQVSNRPATLSLVLSLVALFSQPILPLLILAIVTVAKTHHYPVFEVLTHGIFFIPPILGLASVILAHTARARIRRDPMLPGKTASLVGMIIGYATLTYAISGWLIGKIGSYLLKDMG